MQHTNVTPREFLTILEALKIAERLRREAEQASVPKRKEWLARQAEAFRNIADYVKRP